MRCIKPKVPKETREDSIKHAELVAMDYMTTMRARCTRFDAYIDVHCLERLEIPINLKTHYHDELVARTAEELDNFRQIMGPEPGDVDEQEMQRRRNELRHWYDGALDRKKKEFGGASPLKDLDYDHLRSEIRTHDKTVVFGGASLTALQEILEKEPQLGGKIHYYQQGGTFNPKLNILGNPYNFALNTKAAEYVFVHHAKLASFKLVPTDTTKQIEWTIQGLAKLSPAVGVRSLAFHGRYDPWNMISPKERITKSTKTNEFMAWRSEWASHPDYSTPDKKGYKAVMADLTAFLAAFTDVLNGIPTKDDITTLYTSKVTIDQTTSGSQMVLRKEAKSPIECLMLRIPGQETVLVEDAIGLVERALRTVNLP